MGMHRIEITMIGGHGHDRDAKEGDALAPPCDHAGCPDCAFRKLVQEFAARGCFGYPGTGATMTHWPGEASEVVDDLVAEKRAKGSFKS